MQNTPLIEYLSQFLSERRLALLHEVLRNRTQYFTVLLEDIGQSYNASAVLRSCECLGIQDIHIIENRNKYQYNPCVAMGAGKWTNLIKYNKSENNSIEAIQALKRLNYRIVATMPGKNCTELSNFDISKGKTAFVFGSEITGISPVIQDNADELITIPMFGFTESYNISVSAAIVLFQLLEKLRSSDIDWHLSDQEHNYLLLEWLKSSIKRPELLINKFNSTSNIG